MRKGAYHILSAHTGTGHQTIYPAQWTLDFGGTAFVAVMLAMAAGGAVSSTAGGIKALRLGVIVKSVIQQIKEATRTQVRRHARRATTTWASGSSLPRSPALRRSSSSCMLVTYITGGLVGAAYGYGAGEAMFESISAAANVGLSTGITSPTMPVGLKLFYMFQMWAGRLEFIAVLTLVAYVILGMRVVQGGEHEARDATRMRAPVVAADRAPCCSLR